MITIQGNYKGLTFGINVEYEEEVEVATRCLIKAHDKLKDGLPSPQLDDKGK